MQIATRVWSRAKWWRESGEVAVEVCDRESYRSGIRHVDLSSPRRQVYSELEGCR